MNGYESLEKMASIGLMAAGIAHDLNSPVCTLGLAIDAVLQRLEELELAPPEQPELRQRLRETRKMLVTARRSVEAVGAIIVRLHGLSAREPEANGPTDVAKALEAAAGLVTHAFRGAIALMIDCEASLPLVCAGEAQLIQVFMNLMVNAAQAIEGKPERTTHEEVRVTVRRAGDAAVAITVTDTGPGIPPELHAEIFRPFFTTKPPGVGTGLGLSVVSGIVTELGGRVSLESGSGRGATFTVTLPVA